MATLPLVHLPTWQTVEGRATEDVVVAAPTTVAMEALVVAREEAP